MSQDDDSFQQYLKTNFRHCISNFHPTVQRLGHGLLDIARGNVDHLYYLLFAHYLHANSATVASGDVQTNDQMDFDQEHSVMVNVQRDEATQAGPSKRTLKRDVTYWLRRFNSMSDVSEGFTLTSEQWLRCTQWTLARCMARYVVSPLFALLTTLFHTILVFSEVKVAITTTSLTIDATATTINAALATHMSTLLSPHGHFQGDLCMTKPERRLLLKYLAFIEDMFVAPVLSNVAMRCNSSIPLETSHRVCREGLCAWVELLERCETLRVAVQGYECKPSFARNEFMESVVGLQHHHNGTRLGIFY